MYPFKAIIQELTGDRFSVKAILPAGADPHTYEMLPSDFQSIQNSKAFFYGTETLDGWAAKINVENKIELLSLVPENYLINIKIPHFHSDEQSDTDMENMGVDPHFWTDPNVVRAMIPNLLKELIKLDPANEATLNLNAEKFSEKLTKLDEKIKNETESLKFRNVFTAHPFYSYFFERYDFKVAGSLEIAPGSQPTPKNIKNLIDLVKQENVKTIFTNRQQSDKPAKVLAESSGINEYELDPIGGIEGRMSYEDIILYNLKIIKSALK
ncbi:MAG TPA: metal ABC transporter substrate-binding protein [Ignavibacteriaceae bacterium]|nr:metal ABC transporter substrate-binding protein [Ignavibacteriaceae bacterium]